MSGIFGGSNAGSSTLTLQQLQDEATNGSELAQALLPLATASGLSAVQTAILNALTGKAETFDLNVIANELASITAALPTAGAQVGETRVFNGALPAGWVEVGSSPAFTTAYGFSLGAIMKFPRRADTVYERYGLYSASQCLDTATGDVYYAYNQGGSTTNTCTIEVIRANGTVEFFTSYVENFGSDFNAGMVCDNNYLYIIGGYNYSGAVSLQTVSRIHKTTKVKTTMATFPTNGIAYIMPVWDGGDKIYVAGGSNYIAYQNAIKCYTISTNTWTTKTATLSSIRGCVCLSKLPSGKIFCSGGYNSTSQDVYQIYDPTNDTITGETTFASKSFTTLGGMTGTALGMVGLCLYNGNWGRFVYTESTDGFLLDMNHLCNEAYLVWKAVHPAVNSVGDVFWVQGPYSGTTVHYDYGAGSKAGAILHCPVVSRYQLQNKGFIIGKKI